MTLKDIRAGIEAKILSAAPVSDVDGLWCINMRNPLNLLRFSI
jgi:hypothetical protein